jgi:hypothetical protein
MNELCQNLLLSIWRDDDQIRITLVDELAMLELETCYEINKIKEPHRSQGYFVREAVVIAMRRLVSQAFQEGLISDSPGSSMTSKPVTAESSSTPSETGWELS